MNLRGTNDEIAKIVAMMAALFALLCAIVIPVAVIEFYEPGPSQHQTSRAREPQVMHVYIKGVLP
jgi:hypothetical protein